MSTNEEWAGINRQPNLPVVISGFEYPKPVKALIKKMDAAFEIWAEADTALSVAEDEVEMAKATDARLFAESILNGNDDPGDENTNQAIRKLKGAQILADARRREVNAIGRQLEALMRENIREIAIASIAMARNGLAEQERLMLIAGQTAVDAVKARNEGLLGLRQLSHYTRGIYSYDPGFPVTGQISLPNTREDRIVKIVDDLESLILEGRLFGEIDSAA